MNTRHMAAEYRMSQWTKIMLDRKESGLSVTAYCEGKGIHENTYYYWQKKLRAVANEEMYKIGGNDAIPAPFSFTEVKLAGKLALPPTPSNSQGHLSIEAVGMRITADAGYPIDKLSVLLRMMMRPC